MPKIKIFILLAKFIFTDIKYIAKEINNMKTQPLQIILGPNNLRYVKTKDSKVFLPMELGDEMFNKIQKESNNLEYVAKLVDKPIYFYPKSESATLMNFGTYTSVLDNDGTYSEVRDQINSLTNKVYKEFEAIEKKPSLAKQLIKKIVKLIK